MIFFSFNKFILGILSFYFWQMDNTVLICDSYCVKCTFFTENNQLLISAITQGEMNMTKA